MAAAKRDYYEVLGVDKNASADELQKAYRKMAMRFHPDRNPGDKTSEDKFKEVGEAWEILSNPDKRAAYDRYGHRAFQSGGGGGGVQQDPFEVFREVFGGGRGGGSGIFGDIFGEQEAAGSARGRGQDLPAEVTITFEEAARGVEKVIEISKLQTCVTCSGSGGEAGSRTQTCSTCAGHGQVAVTRGFFSIAQTCPKCRGRGQIVEKPCPTCRGDGRVEKTAKVPIKIPAGVDDGARLRSTGHGESGIRGGPPGDLYTRIRVLPNDIFQRDGMDLFCSVPISFARAALGGEVKVPTLDGSSTIKVSPGTPSGKVFRLRGKGLPDVHGRSIVGDLHVKVYVEVPTRLTSAQRTALEAFAASCDEHSHPEENSFFRKAKEFFR